MPRLRIMSESERQLIRYTRYGMEQNEKKEKKEKELKWKMTSERETKDMRTRIEEGKR